MTNIIEETNRRQKIYWGRYLLSWIMLIALLAVRYVFGTALKDQEIAPTIRILTLAASVALLIMMIVHLVKLGRLAARARAHPGLKEALIDNELVKLHLTQSYKSGFVGASVTPLVFLLISSLLYPINDPLMVALATPIVGSGAFLISFFLKSHS
jgi:hypothetical protein